MTFFAAGRNGSTFSDLYRLDNTDLRLIISTCAASRLRLLTTATVTVVNNPFVRGTSYTFTVTDNSGKTGIVVDFGNLH